MVSERGKLTLPLGQKAGSQSPFKASLLSEKLCGLAQAFVSLLVCCHGPRWYEVRLPLLLPLCRVTHCMARGKWGVLHVEYIASIEKCTK